MTEQHANKRMCLPRCAAAAFFAVSAATLLLDASTAIGEPFSLKSFHEQLQADASEAAPPEAPQSPSTPPSEPAAEYLPFTDPIEPVNRVLHDLNRLVYTHAIDPVAVMYIDNTSPALRAGIYNMMENLREPFTAGSALIEGDLADAGSATIRFAINSTVGILGYHDVAKEQGYVRQGRSVEQALCRQDVPSGPYLVMPVLGPATIRDATGRLATMYVQYLVLGYAVIPYRIIDILSHYTDRRDDFRALDDTLIDNYAGYRSVYGQLLVERCARDGTPQPFLFKP